MISLNTTADPSGMVEYEVKTEWKAMVSGTEDISEIELRFVIQVNDIKISSWNAQKLIYVFKELDLPFCNSSTFSSRAEILA